MPDVFDTAIDNLAVYSKKILCGPRAIGNISEWAKKTACWEKMKNNLNFSFSDQSSKVRAWCTEEDLTCDALLIGTTMEENDLKNQTE